MTNSVDPDLLQIQLPNITDELSIEVNTVDPEQTAPMGPQCLLLYLIRQ